MNITDTLHNSWRGALADYRRGRINSERTLQATLYHFLRTGLPDQFKVLCEPGFRINGYGLLIPDMVVAEAGTIVAVVEMKFVPHHFAIFEADLVKLKTYGQTNASVPLVLDPRTGNFAEERFSMGEGCLLVFAVISRSDAWAVDEARLRHEMAEFEPRFVPLCHAVSAEA